MKRSICILLSIIISISAVIYNIGALAAEMIETVEISLNDNFADNRIIVVLNNQVSLSFKEYSTHDFDEITLKSIKNLSESAGQKVEAAMTNVADHITKNVDLIPYDGIPLDNYKQILCLELSAPGKANVISAVKELQKRDDVLLAVPDYELVACGLEPTDPYYQSKMNSWAEHIGLENAWDYAEIYLENASAVRVGIIDSGIDGSHPDLIDNINVQLCENFTQSAEDSDYDGGLVDDLGHGTMCASVVGAVANNDEGSAGVCWNVELVSLKIYDGNTAYSSYVAEAIDSADEKDIDILSLSWRWNIPNDRITYGSYDEALDSSISNYSGLFICGAGNDSANIDSSSIQELPSSYQGLTNKIVVGSSNFDEISTFSNTGATTVDLFAQGENIFVAYPGEKCDDGTHFDPNNPITLNAHEDTGYHRSSGTSFAAPLVAGVAAIMMCVDPYYLPNHPEVVKSKICSSTVNPNGNFDGECLSNGRLDAYTAVYSVFHEDTPVDPETCPHTNTYYEYTSAVHTQYCSLCETALLTQNHTLSSVSLGDEEHTNSCTKCGYSITEDHDLYVASVYNDIYTIQCHECSYSFNCNCDREYESDGATGHYVNCLEGCFSNLEPHIYETTGEYNSSGHEIECVYCDYIKSVSHDLYMYSEDTEDYVVKCYECNYTVECWESPEYFEHSDYEHWVGCPDGCYSFYEPHTPGSYVNTGEATHDVVCDDCGYVYSEDHTFGNSASSYNSSYHFYQCIDCGATGSEAHSLIYSDTDSLYTHSIECRDCDYQSTENHNWIRRGTGYLCTICGQSEAFIPSVVMSLPDPELRIYLASLSDEELDSFIASLPEDQLDRVTALLPPENDDELLTE